MTKIDETRKRRKEEKKAQCTNGHRRGKREVTMGLQEEIRAKTGKDKRGKKSHLHFYNGKKQVGQVKILTFWDGAKPAGGEKPPTKPQKPKGKAFRVTLRKEICYWDKDMKINRMCRKQEGEKPSCARSTE